MLHNDLQAFATPLEQEQREKNREKKETAKKHDLEKATTGEALTETAAKARTLMAKEVEGNHKEVMKMVYTLKTTSDERQGDPSPSGAKKSKKKNKGKKKVAVAASVTTNDNEAVPLENGAITKEKAPRKKKPPAKIVSQGKRKVPEASDGHGCKHHGLLELLALPKGYLKVYVREGEWLHNKPCKDCAQKESGCPDLVLDISSLLKVKGKGDVIGYYCNCGPTGHKMKGDEDPVYKQQYDCDMVLCLPCYDERKLRMGDGGTAKRLRRRKQY